jgi:hypothetical protein
MPTPEMLDPLAVPLATFARRKHELLRAGHGGKWVLIYRDDVAGLFDSRQQGLADGYRRFGNAPFLVREVLDRAPPVAARSAPR